MKKFATIIFLVFVSNTVFGQIVLENVYDSASVLNQPSNSFAMGSQLLMVDFEVSGLKYVRINREFNTITVYNLNHTLYKSIQIPYIPTSLHYDNHVMYLSEHLFDMDDDIEYLHAVYIKQPYPHFETSVYDESGAILFHVENEFPGVIGAWHMQQYPIYNTPLGTKLILSDYDTGEGKVYSLPGTLTTAMVAETGKSNSPDFILYPNPSNSDVTIEYSIQSLADEGLLVVYDENGSEIRSFELDPAQASIVFSVADLSVGTYFISIIAGRTIFQAQKLIISE